MATPRHSPYRIAALGSSIACLIVLLTGCGDDNDPVTEPTDTPRPSITAPPTQTPEEQAEAEIINAFQTLVALRDEFNAAANEYTLEEVSDGEPVTSWNVTGGGELELMNQANLWWATNLNAVGETAIASHDITDVRLDVTGDLDIASSTACLDISNITFATYDGQPTDPPFEPDPSQIWIMEWEYLPEAAPTSGIDEPGWYMAKLETKRGQSC